jgi:hypothetical protein
MDTLHFIAFLTALRHFLLNIYNIFCSLHFGGNITICPILESIKNAYDHGSALENVLNMEI